MKNILLLLLTLSTLVKAQNNTYTLSEKITQSTIHDAIQLYYAKSGLTFYFKRVTTKTGFEAVNDFEVIDLYNSKNLGSITNFASDLNAATTPPYDYNILIEAFIKQYNGKFTYVLNKLVKTETDRTSEMCLQIIKRILGRNAGFGKDSIEIIPYDTISERYAENPFLTPTKQSDKIALNSNHVKNNLIPKVVSAASLNFPDMGGAGGLVGNLARGTAKFLIERANQEINAAAFRRLKAVMDDTPELQKLFPDTYSVTANIESFNFDVALNTFRTKITNDLENILGNISSLATLEKYQKTLNTIPALTYFFAACDVMHELNAETSPGQIIHKVYTAPYVTSPATNNANVFKLTGFLSFSLRDIMISDANYQSKGWISQAELNYNTDVLREILNNYLGLLYQSDPGIRFDIKNKTISFRDNLANFKGSINAVGDFISATYESLEIIADEISGIRQSNQAQYQPDPALIDPKKFDHYKKIGVETLNMAERTILFPRLLPDDVRGDVLKMITDLKEVYIPAVTQAVNIASCVQKKEYNEAIYNAGILVEHILNEFREDNDKNKMLSNLFKYGQFFASVAVAENGEDVKNAIDAIALPTGSSSIKKDLAFNIAVNGYIGYFRRNVPEENTFIDGFTQSYGITAPVGFTMSTGFRKGGSLSVFGGVIDVGAIAQYELKRDADTGDTSVEPDIQWANIFSPSLHVVYGLPFYIPLSLGIGGQWLANSTEGTNSKFTLEPRFNAFVCFDIPIVNIVSRKRLDRIKDENVLKKRSGISKRKIK